MSNFQPLEVVGRGSETQLQEAENLNSYFSRIRVNTWSNLNQSVSLILFPGRHCVLSPSKTWCWASAGSMLAQWVKNLCLAHIKPTMRRHWASIKPTLGQHQASIGSVLSQHLAAELFNSNFHPLEVVSHWRDPQLQVSENYSDLTKWM